MPSARGPRTLLLAALVLAGAAFGGRAEAFDYQEHYAITRAVLERVGEARLPAFAESLAHLAGAGAHLCFPPTSLGARGGRSCFVAADIAALAGDHATSATRLLGRWLRRRGDDDAPISGEGDDESCEEDRRRLADFLVTVNQLE